jgi:5'(3')-deoxyribonucleotidase
MRILLDCDGVIVDYIGRYLQFLNELRGSSFKHEDVTDWNTKDVLKVTDEEEEKVFERMERNLDFEELPGAVDAVKRIASVHDVCFVTAPHDTIREWTYARARWLRQRFPLLPVIHTSRKAYIWGDLFIDDKLANLYWWLKANPHGGALLWAQPWNNVATTLNVQRTNQWDKVTKALGC